ncbi:hypothetical protein GGR52DRAFT_591436 [Hypoxylon sp. FL1284]|nr:hypothetical protein GGR52DRAFT_591436 [Hypoxylon sp. FL1284]
MAPAPPTCAARIIRNEPLQNGWGAALTGETNAAVNKVKKYAKDCYGFQLHRERPVDASALSSALFWEHRHVVQPHIVSTPAADYGGLFNRELKLSNLKLWAIKPRAGTDFLEVNALFGPMRDREFTVWPVQVPEGKSDENKCWVTVIMRVEPTEVVVNTSSKYIDRVVTDIAIMDSLLSSSKRRDSRQKLVEKRLAEILELGGIEFSEAAERHELQTEGTMDSWATGYIAYAVCREFLRRLKVLIHRRQRLERVPEHFLWYLFEETYNIHTYRESLMAACAHQTIEMSGYRVRMALDVPSEKTNHKPDELSHLKVKSVMSPPEDVPDEDYKASSPKFAVLVPEGVKLEVSSEEDSDSDDESSMDESENESKTKPARVSKSPAIAPHGVGKSPAVFSHSHSPSVPIVSHETEDIELPDYEDAVPPPMNVGPTEALAPVFETQVKVEEVAVSMAPVSSTDGFEASNKRALEDEGEEPAKRRRVSVHTVDDEDENMGEADLFG